MNPSISELREHLPPSFRVAFPVDHPVLLDGPDVLIGGDGHLISLYYAKKQRSLSNLHARVAASKLALPDHCLHVLIAHADEADNSLVTNSVQAFDRIAEFNDLRRTNLIRERPRENSTRELGRVKGEQAILYSRAFRFSSARRKFQKDDGSSSRIAHALNEGKSRKSSILKYRGIDLSAREAPATLAYVKKLCQFRFSDYVFDNAVPYPKTKSPGFAISDTVPEIKTDPEKPLRAASFSGWIVTDASSLHDLDATIDRAKQFGFDIP